MSTGDSVPGILPRMIIINLDFSILNDSHLVRVIIARLMP